MEHDRTSPIVLPPGIGAMLARVEGDIREPMRSVSRALLDHEERLIKETLLRMASLIEERIRVTVDALETHDAALALTVIEGDVEINAMQAEALDHIATELESLLEEGIEFNAAIQKVLEEIMTLHGSVVFNGNGYSQEWQDEAARRGLLNHRNTVDALPEMLTPAVMSVSLMCCTAAG